MNPAYIYVLHFNEPLHHARHYTGCTTHLQARLTAHANGQGSSLSRYMWANQLEWTLGSLFVCTKAAMRRHERALKNTNNAPKFCGICFNPPARLPETTPYPLEAIPFGITSATIRKNTNWIPSEIRVRLTSTEEPKTTILLILDLMKRDKDALGFIPCGGAEGIQVIHDKSLIAIVSNRNTDVGYAAFTISNEDGQPVRLNIHQCVVADDARLLGHGKALVEFIAEKFPTLQLTAKVRDDLAANEFWLSMGFQLINQRKHKTSLNPINQYVRPALIPGGP